MLAAAAGLSVRRAQAIHANSVELVTQRISTSGLANNLLVVQQRIGKELYYLRSLRPADAERIHAEVQSAERELQEMQQLAVQARAEELQALLRVSIAFARAVREATGKYVTPEILAELHGYREDFSRMAVEAVRNESARTGSLQAAIERDAAQLRAESLYLLGGCLLLAIGGAVLTVRASHQFLHQIQWQAGELNRVSWQMLESQETTARRFSHELHDELGQSLAGVRAILVGMKPENVTLRRTECIGLLDESIQNVRELSQLLRPVILDDFGLDAGLGWLCERFTSRTRIEVKYRSEVHERFADDLETQFFRISQEALTNVARHSGATNVFVELRIRDGKLHLTVEDNGKGMPAGVEHGQSSLGLVGMRARARQSGGELAVTNGTHGGVKLEVWAPVRKVSEIAEHKDTHPIG
ncbi:MAG: hypothetical protein JNK48_07595 [Bryobacterales bacterium]|nr:hypothetical protein [Bryobacterales bacterium]